MAVGPAHSYIEEGISKGVSEHLLNKVVDDAQVVASLSLPPVYSLKHLSHYTGINYLYLRFIVRREHDPYQPYSIQKRSGGFRFIHAPEEKIKVVQRWIAGELLYRVQPHWRCYSYHKESSIKKCAAQHCQSRWLIKIDIERFFESVSEFQVYKVFRGLGYKPLVAFELTRLCTVYPRHLLGKHSKRWILYSKQEEGLPYSRRSLKYVGRLPQGAPTSPQLSNLVFKELDEVFNKIASDNGLVYTRYADDIAFSTRNKSFNRDKALLIVRKVNNILLKNDYTPQHKKLKIIPPGARKIVMGLDVSSNEPRLSKSFKKRIETHLRGMEVFGIPEHAVHRKFHTFNGMLDHVRGLINYADHIEPETGEKLKNRFDRVVESAGLEL